jgi:hypothetical protein
MPRTGSPKESSLGRRLREVSDEDNYHRHVVRHKSAEPTPRRFSYPTLQAMGAGTFPFEFRPTQILGSAETDAGDYQSQRFD